MNKTDLRYQKTRNSIYNALSVLLKNKRFRDIEIMEICREANISRNAFYAHYSSKEELLQEVADEIGDRFSLHLNLDETFYMRFSEENIEKVFRTLFKSISPYREYLKEFFSDSDLMGYLYKFEGVLNYYIMQTIDMSVFSNRITVKFILAGINGIFFNYATSNDEHTEEQYSRECARICSKLIYI